MLGDQQKYNYLKSSNIVTLIFWKGNLLKTSPEEGKEVWDPRLRVRNLLI